MQRPFLPGVLRGPPRVPGVFVLLAVNDNGCGMDEKTLANIFELLFASGSGRVGGAGPRGADRYVDRRRGDAPEGRQGPAQWLQGDYPKIKPLFMTGYTAGASPLTVAGPCHMRGLAAGKIERIGLDRPLLEVAALSGGAGHAVASADASKRATRTQTVTNFAGSCAIPKRPMGQSRGFPGCIKEA